MQLATKLPRISYKEKNRRTTLLWRETSIGSRLSWPFAGVRQHGSYKRYARSFHRDVLAVRGLAQRGKLSTDDSVLNFLARLGDNGVVWHVLEYWRATR